MTQAPRASIVPRATSLSDHGSRQSSLTEAGRVGQRPSTLRALLALPPTVKTTTVDPRPAVVA